MSAENFPLSRLPADLRNKIWDMAIIEETQNRSVYVHQCRVRPVSAFHWQKEYRVKPSLDLVSIIMNVCRESRDRALKIYTWHLKLLFDPPPRYNAPWTMMPYGSGPVLPCHPPGDKWIMGEIYLSPKHDIFVTGLASEAHACELYKYDMGNGSMLSRVLHHRGEYERLVAFLSHVSEPLESAQLCAVKRARQIRHEKCTPAYHLDIQNNNRILICECGFGGHVAVAYRNTVDSTPLQVLFPNATIGPTWVFDVGRARDLLHTLARIINGDFHRD